MNHQMSRISFASTNLLNHRTYNIDWKQNAKYKYLLDRYKEKIENGTYAMDGEPIEMSKYLAKILEELESE